MQNHIPAIASFLNERKEAYVDDLAALVNVDSGTYDKAGVDQIGRWVRSRLAQMDAQVHRYPQQEFGDCVLGRWLGSGDGRVLIVAHMDTVYAPGTAAERPLRINGDRAIGPGAADMKGGLLAGLNAVAALQGIGFTGFAEIAFWVNSDEEVGSPASRHLTADFARQADAVLVLEPARANGDIVSARKGNGQYTITVQGRSAHSGVEPEKGVHAILELAHVLIALHELNGLRPGVSVNANVVSGGTRTNVIPDRAEARVDVRVPDEEAAAAIHQAIHALAGPGRDIAGTVVKVDGAVTMPPMPLSPATARLAALATGIAREIGFELHDTFTGGGSDGNFAAASGIPVLDGLGPVGGLVHSPHEYLEIETIVPRTILLAGLIMSITQGGVKDEHRGHRTAYSRATN